MDATHLYHQRLVRDFHEAFGHPVNHTVIVPDEATLRLRLRLIFEEAKELAQALGMDICVDGFRLEDSAEFDFVPNGKSVDLVEAADALGDIDYVTQGANVVFGFPGHQIFMAIHKSNMSKLGADGRSMKDEFGKTTKGPNYKPPTEAIRGLLALYGAKRDAT